jgi:hypothetical protein
MARIYRKPFHAGSYWPMAVGFSLLVFLSASGIVLAGPSWSHRMISGLAAAPHKVVKAAYHPATAPAIGSVDGDYLQGLAKAVPGLVRR